METNCVLILDCDDEQYSKLSFLHPSTSHFAEDNDQDVDLKEVDEHEDDEDDHEDEHEDDDVDHEYDEDGLLSCLAR